MIFVFASWQAENLTICWNFKWPLKEKLFSLYKLERSKKFHLLYSKTCSSTQKRAKSSFHIKLTRKLLKNLFQYSSLNRHARANFSYSEIYGKRWELHSMMFSFLFSSVPSILTHRHFTQFRFDCKHLGKVIDEDWGPHRKTKRRKENWTEKNVNLD